ncbi:MAG TPA: ATP-dependent DNA ligase, partial [Actinomycetota bacterium]|nr:ATP-dependent DNA ligase [Actinomycetota bacterium]
IPVEPQLARLDTVPARFADRGVWIAAVDDVRGSIEPLLDLADRDEAGGLGDAPWPPHFPKGQREPTRVAPSRARKSR